MRARRITAVEASVSLQLNQKQQFCRWNDDAGENNSMLAYADVLSERGEAKDVPEAALSLGAARLFIFIGFHNRATSNICYGNSVSDKRLPSGSVNHAILALLGAVQIPFSSWFIPSYRTK